LAKPPDGGADEGRFAEPRAAFDGDHRADLCQASGHGDDFVVAPVDRARFRGADPGGGESDPAGLHGPVDIAHLPGDRVGGGPDVVQVLS
jgi:hypothetical protein